MSSVAVQPELELDRVIREWNGLFAVSRYHEPTDTWIFVAVHNVDLGPAVGGTRMRHYDAPAEGLREAMRLAEVMTRKWAMMGAPLGGGKAVLAVPEQLSPARRAEVLGEYAAVLSALRGSFSTAEDLGTAPADMSALHRWTPWIRGVDPESGEVEPGGPFTARGVVAGIRAALEHQFGIPDLRGRRILIEGVGNVGGLLARYTHEAGAEVLLADVDAAKAEHLGTELGATVIGLSEVYRTECDVYAPCAVGRTLCPPNIGLLRCSVVAGAANDQLASSEDANRLHDRGILYAPDFVINAGAALAIDHLGRETPVEDRLAAVDAIGDVLRDVFKEASREEESPEWAARRRVDLILDEARLNTP